MYTAPSLVYVNEKKKKIYMFTVTLDFPTEAFELPYHEWKLSAVAFNSALNFWYKDSEGLQIEEKAESEYIIHESMGL